MNSSRYQVAFGPDRPQSDLVGVRFPVEVDHAVDVCGSASPLRLVAPILSWRQFFPPEPHEGRAACSARRLVVGDDSALWWTSECADKRVPGPSPPPPIRPSRLRASRASGKLPPRGDVEGPGDTESAKLERRWQTCTEASPCGEQSWGTSRAHGSGEAPRVTVRAAHAMPGLLRAVMTKHRHRYSGLNGTGPDDERLNDETGENRSSYGLVRRR